MTYQIYYIHGFGSSVNSTTLKKLQEYYPDAIGLEYDHTAPLNSLEKMSRIVAESFHFPIIIGSSLGGWYADQLGTDLSCDVILYNPSTQPWDSLGRYGVISSVCDQYFDANLPTDSPRTVVLSLDDEIIDPSVALIKYESSSCIIKTGGGHRMTDENMAIISERIEYLSNQL